MVTLSVRTEFLGIRANAPRVQPSSAFCVLTVTSRWNFLARGSCIQKQLALAWRRCAPRDIFSGSSYTRLHYWGNELWGLVVEANDSVANTSTGLKLTRPAM